MHTSLEHRIYLQTCSNSLPLQLHLLIIFQPTAATLTQPLGVTRQVETLQQLGLSADCNL